MNFKSEKGVVGTDITVALIVVMIFMSILGVLFFNISKVAKGIERESKATYIATDVIEAARAKQYSALMVTNGETDVTSGGNYQGVSDVISLGRSPNLEAGYTCQIKVENYVPTAYAFETDTDLVKVVTVKVQYKLAAETKTVTLRTTVLREI